MPLFFIDKHRLCNIIYCMIQIILLLAGFILLIKGADLLVDGASSTASYFKVPDIVIGLTIVAFGTSAPEMIVSILASAKGSTDIAIGNIFGSNIFNTLLIIGISSIIYTLRIKSHTIRNEIPLSVLAILAVTVLANDQLIDKAAVSQLSRIDGIVLLLFFSIFLWYMYYLATKERDMQTDIRRKNPGVSVIFIIIGIAALGLGGKLVVDSAVFIARVLKVSENMIGLTIVAAGTSLPELVTSAMAAYRKNTEIAVGNIIGSNIFNLFFILGISSVIRPLTFNIASNIDAEVTLAASIMLLIFAAKKFEIHRRDGIIMVLSYAAYFAYLIVRK